VHGFFKQLAREVEARHRRVDVFVEVEDEVVGDDGITCREEGYETLDDVDLGRGDLRFEVCEVGLEVDLFDGPGVLDAVAEHVVEDRERHRTKGEAGAQAGQPEFCRGQESWRRQ
jgi:hypothetical protein